MGLSVIPATTSTPDTARGSKSSREAGDFFGIISGELTGSNTSGHANASGRHARGNHKNIIAGFAPAHNWGSGADVSEAQNSKITSESDQKAGGSPEVGVAARQAADAERETRTSSSGKRVKDCGAKEDDALAPSDEKEDAAKDEGAPDTAVASLAAPVHAAEAVAASITCDVEVLAEDAAGEDTAVEAASAADPDWQGESQLAGEVAGEGETAEGVAPGASPGSAARGESAIAPGVYVEAENASPSGSQVGALQNGIQAPLTDSRTDAAEAEAFLTAVAESRADAGASSTAPANSHGASVANAAGEGATNQAETSPLEIMAATQELAVEEPVLSEADRRGSGHHHGAKDHALAMKSGWRLWGRQPSTDASSVSASAGKVEPKVATPNMEVPKPAQTASESTKGRTGGVPVEADRANDRTEAGGGSASSKFGNAQAREPVDSPTAAATSGIASGKESEGATAAGVTVAARVAEHLTEIPAKVPARAELQEDTRAAREVFRQVQGGLRVAFLQRGERAVIQLMPEALGRVQVALSRTSQGLTANFRVETTEARDALSSQIVQLKSGFESRGVNLVSVNVELGNEKSMSNGGQADQKRNQRRQVASLGALEADNTLKAKESSWKPWGFETRA